MVTRSQLQQRPPATVLGKLAFHVSRFTNALETRRELKALAVLATTSPVNIGHARRSERRAVARSIRVLGKNRPAAVQNWYESGLPFLNGSRSHLPSLIQDARYDQNMVTRRELLRKMRYWSQNSGLCKSTLDVSRQYVIGTHTPVITSLAGDSKWADAAEQVFCEMIEKAGLDGESLLQMLTVAHDCKKIDGDVLFVETSRRQPFTIRRGTPHETEILKSVPCFQMVEGHRIETPPSLWNQEGISIVDGVQFQIVEHKLEDGRARKAMVRQGYWVRDAANSVAMNDESYSFIPVAGAVLVFTPNRINQVRGLSDYYAGETMLAMIEDLLKLELRAQEVQSNLTVFITNGAGQIVDQKTQAYMGGLGLKLAKDAEGKPIVTTKDIEQAKEVYKQINGGETFVGRTGDTLGFLAPTRPAEATLNLWEYLINIWCASARTVRVLVFPKTTKGQGTEVRAEIDKVNTAFIGEFNLNWKPVMQRAWEYFIGWAKDNDERLKNPPADWKHIEVSPPRSVLVDHGYDSAAMLAELAAGVTNLHFIAQRLGTTGKKLIAAAVKDIFMLKQECARISKQPVDNIQVSAEEVRQSLSDVIKNLAAMKTAENAKATAEQFQEA